MEVAAGLVIAEEVISSTLQGGAVAALAVAKPTLPLKCSLSQFAHAPKDGSSASLARANHTFNIVTGDLYIFGGIVAPDKLAGNEMHVIKLSNQGGLGPQYKCVPAIARDGESEDVPVAREGHTTVVINDDIIMFGGYSDAASKQPIDEHGRVWIFSTTALQWRHVDSEIGPPARAEHAAVTHDGLVIIHGGRGAQGDKNLTDTWAFNPVSRVWNQLPDLKDDSASTLPPSFAAADGKLYLISKGSELGSTIQVLNLKATEPPEWTTIPFPTNPLTPGPKPRTGAGLVPVFTGQGRGYLLYILGEKTDTEDTSESPQWSGIWALQLPSTSGAGLKDTVREKVGADTHEAEWAEVEIVPSEQVGMTEGKAHPGPRAYFACDVIPSTNKVMFWGGVDPSGKCVGDGWVIDIKTPSVKGMMKNVPGLKNFVKSDE